MCMYVHICICICFHFVYISIIKHLLHDNKIANNNKIANTHCMSPHGDFTQAPKVSSSLKDHHDLGLRRPATACAVM